MAPAPTLDWLSRYEGLARLRKIAATLRLRSAGYISNLIAFCERELASDSLLRDLVDQCVAILRPSRNPLDEMRVQCWPALPLTDTIGDAPVYLA